MRHFVSSLTRGVAALLIVAGVASATPIALSTPTGLNPGDKFRFIAVTSGTTNATSTDINDYNTFVQNDFGGATYNGVVVNWKAIGSTATVSARDNVGGYETVVPVYKPFTGTLVATQLDTTYYPGGGMYGLWSAGRASAPDETLTGIASGPLWTGTLGEGQRDSFAYLGDSTSAYQGSPTTTAEQWLISGGEPTSELRGMYALSEELTAGGAPVPEIDPAGMGSVLALVTGGLGLLERRRLTRKTA